MCAVCLTSSCLFVRDAGVKRQAAFLIHDAIGQPSSQIHGHVVEGHPSVCEGVGSDDSMIQKQYPAAPMMTAASPSSERRRHAAHLMHAATQTQPSTNGAGSSLLGFLA